MAWADVLVAVAPSIVVSKGSTLVVTAPGLVAPPPPSGIGSYAAPEDQPIIAAKFATTFVLPHLAKPKSIVEENNDP